MKRKLLPEEAPQYSPPLPQDIINLVATHIPYTKGLAAFRQTCTHYNELIENTDTGKLARKASNLKPSGIVALINSILENNKYNIGKISPYIGCLLSVMGLSDFPNGINELSVGVNFAKSTAHFINGLTVPFNCFDYRYNDALIDPLLTTIIIILNPTFSFTVSMVAIMISSELRGVYDIPGLDAFPNSYLELCKRYCSPLTPSGNYPPTYYESGFAKANVKVMQDSFITAGMYSIIPNAVACLTRMGLFAINKASRSAHLEQNRIRKPLYKPYSK